MDSERGGEKAGPWNGSRCEVNGILPQNYLSNGDKGGLQKRSVATSSGHRHRKQEVRRPSPSGGKLI